MSKIKGRLDSLEKLNPYCGFRPPGMTDADFGLYLTRMAPAQLRPYLRTLPDADLNSGIAYLQGIVLSTEEQQHGNTQTAP